MHATYFLTPLLLEPVCHLGEVYTGLGTVALALGLAPGNLSLFFWEFKKEAEYMCPETVTRSFFVCFSFFVWACSGRQLCSLDDTEAPQSSI